MPADNNLVLVALTTVTSTSSVAAASTLTTLSLRNPTYGGTTSNPGGTSRFGLNARINISGLGGSTPTMDFTIEHSDDSANWALLVAPMGYQGTNTIPTARVTAGPQNLFAHVVTDKPYIRLITNNTGTVSATLTADMMPSYP